MKHMRGTWSCVHVFVSRASLADHVVFSRMYVYVHPFNLKLLSDSDSSDFDNSLSDGSWFLVGSRNSVCGSVHVPRCPTDVGRLQRSRRLCGAGSGAREWNGKL